MFGNPLVFPEFTGEFFYVPPVINPFLKFPAKPGRHAVHLDPGLYKLGGDKKVSQRMGGSRGFINRNLKIDPSGRRSNQLLKNMNGKIHSFLVNRDIKPEIVRGK